MRQHYIDNIRSLTILLLFPVHTFMVWNDFGSGFYIWLGENRILSTLIVLVNPWFMPMLFVLAGMSARYALERRTVKEFVVQRIWKLLVPFAFGMVFLVPVQTLYARKFFCHYEGGILENWKYFFTHITDLTGYDGAFTPGHLWFILFLLVISMVSLIIFRYLPYGRVQDTVVKMPACSVIFLFVPIWLMYYLGNFGGFSLGKDFMLYLLGYYVLSNENILDKMEERLAWLAALYIAGTVALVVMYYYLSYYGDLWVNFIGWVSVLFLLVLGRRFLNSQTKFTKYFNKASYPIYILHQSVLVAAAYYLVKVCDVLVLQVIGICMGSFCLTILAYHLCRKVPVLGKISGCV